MKRFTKTVCLDGSSFSLLQFTYPWNLLTTFTYKFIWLILGDWADKFYKF